jgi:uncharacterized protein (TIGR03086 family)
MTEISDRYDRLSDRFAQKISVVPDDRWSNPSPCSEWTARDVVRHVVQTQGMFLGFIGKELGDIPSVDDDPAAAWDAARGAVQARLDDPATARSEYEGHFGRATFEDSVDRFLNTDLVVHGWDLARAAGLDDQVDDDDVKRVQATAESFGDAMRGPQAFGPALDPPAGADAQDRLMAFLGRRV